MSNDEEEVDRLKMEIREVKALIWEGRMKLSATSDGEERQFLREEQRWLFDETRKIRDEVRLRLEARNMRMAGRYAAAADSSSPPAAAAAAAAAAGVLNAASSNKMPVPAVPVPTLQRHPDSPAAWGFPPPDFAAGCGGWPAADKDVSAWTPQPQQHPHKPRLPPLRPRMDGHLPTATADVPKTAMQPPKCNGSSRKRRSCHTAAAAAASAIKEEEGGCGGVREERGKRPRWKDHWVMQLIQVRGGMQVEFSKPPKQGVDLWRQVYTKLVASCPDFDKEPEACRKKWKMLVTDYKAASPSAVPSASGSSDAKCRYYSVMDEYINVKGSAEDVTSGLDCGLDP